MLSHSSLISLSAFGNQETGGLSSARRLHSQLNRGGEKGMATGWSPGCERGGNTTLGSAYCSATTWSHQEFNQIQIKKTGFAPISRRDGNKIYQLGSFHMPPSSPKISEKCWSYKTVHSGFLSRKLLFVLQHCFSHPAETSCMSLIFRNIIHKIWI